MKVCWKILFLLAWVHLYLAPSLERYFHWLWCLGHGYLLLEWKRPFHCLLVSFAAIAKSAVGLTGAPFPDSLLSSSGCFSHCVGLVVPRSHPGVARHMHLFVLLEILGASLCQWVSLVFLVLSLSSLLFRALVRFWPDPGLLSLSPLSQLLPMSPISSLLGPRSR